MGISLLASAIVCCACGKDDVAEPTTVKANKSLIQESKNQVKASGGSMASANPDPAPPGVKTGTP